MCRGDVCDPVAQRLVGGVLERARAGRHRHHPRPHQLHAVHVQALAAHVLLAHIDHALEPEAGAHRGRGDAVLARARLGDDARFAHAPRQEHLPQRVVDLVRPGVVQVFALEHHDDPWTHLRPEPRRLRERSGASHIVLEQPVQLGPEARVALRFIVDPLELLERRHQGLGDIAAAVGAEAAGGGDAGEIGHGPSPMRNAECGTRNLPRDGRAAR